MQVTIPRTIPEQLFVGWCVVTVALTMLNALDVDFRLADFLYQAQGAAWHLRDDPFASGIMHQGGRLFSQLLAVGVLAAYLASFAVTKIHHWRRPLAYLFVATVLSSLLVAAIKLNVPMDCPWGLQRYGGSQPFIGLLEPRPASMPDSACFPSGHASAGYAWVALYWFFAAIVPRYKWHGLVFALLLGGVFGLTQQLRGAHFLSHDLWALAICWTVASVLAQAWLRND